jgi:hypothetical protein
MSGQLMLARGGRRAAVCRACESLHDSQRVGTARVFGAVVRAVVPTDVARK